MPQILLIDDDPAQLCVREAVLQQAGFSILTASTASEAQDRLGKSEINSAVGLIITDHMMPGASGSAFVRELRKLSPLVPVIVISGLAEAEEEYSGLNVTFLTKPCEPEMLIAKVRTLVQDSA